MKLYADILLAALILLSVVLTVIDQLRLTKLTQTLILAGYFFYVLGDIIKIVNS